MFIFKRGISLVLFLGLISCQKDGKNHHEQPSVLIYPLGVSLQSDSPYAAKLPLFHACKSGDPAVAARCPVTEIPFIGEEGLPVTREAIKKHSLAAKEEQKALLDKYIDELPDEWLPLFARFKVISALEMKPLIHDVAASFGVLDLGPFVGISCDFEPGLCEPEPRLVPASLNMIASYVAKDTRPPRDAIAIGTLLYTAHGLCNAADAYATHDLAALKNRSDAKGQIQLQRFSMTSAYAYSRNQNLQAYWNNLKMDASQRIVIDSRSLIAGLDDSSASALNSSFTYEGPTQDFIGTCASYLLLRSYGISLASLVFDPSSGEIFRTQKDQLGTTAVQGKLAGILPLIFQDGDVAEALKALPPPSELSKFETDQLLLGFKFN